MIFSSKLPPEIFFFFHYLQGWSSSDINLRAVFLPRTQRYEKVLKEGARGDAKSLLILVNRGWRGLGLLSKYKAGKHNFNCRLVLAHAQIDPDCPTA